MIRSAIIGFLAGMATLFCLMWMATDTSNEKNKRILACIPEPVLIQAIADAKQANKDAKVMAEKIVRTQKIIKINE